MVKNIISNYISHETTFEDSNPPWITHYAFGDDAHEKEYGQLTCWMKNYCLKQIKNETKKSKTKTLKYLTQLNVSKIIWILWLKITNKNTTTVYKISWQVQWPV